MARLKHDDSKILKTRSKFKKTSQDIRNPKKSSMNKSKKRNFKKYRGQGRP